MDCSQKGIVYAIICNECQEVVDNNNESLINNNIRDKKDNNNITTNYYLGMTYTSCHNRMLAHTAGHRRRDIGNPLHQHDVEKHDGCIQSYTTTVMSKNKDLLSLMMKEAIMIEKQNNEISMNGKNEMGRGNMVRLVARRSENG